MLQMKSGAVMTSKERVWAALDKKPVDRLPVYMWFHPGLISKLSKLLEIPPEHVEEVMGNDVCQAWVGNNYAMGGITLEHEGQTYVDAWGIEWRKEGEFNQISRYPLVDASDEALLYYSFPENHIEELLGRMEGVAAYRENFFIGCDVSPCVFEMYWRLRGMEQAMLDMAMNAPLAMKMFEKCADFGVRLAGMAADRYRLDWLWTGDDAASQQAMLMSPAAWRDLVKPNLKKIIDAGKSRGLPVAFHSCGAISPIIPDLIEIGVNVLNPVQGNCAGMNPSELKRQFGSDIAFMGGVDTQYLLPQGTVDEVRSVTAKLIGDMTSDGGGYILAASHTLPPETPLENIFALYAEAGISKQVIFDKAADLRVAAGN